MLVLRIRMQRANVSLFVDMGRSLILQEAVLKEMEKKHSCEREFLELLIQEEENSETRKASQQLSKESQKDRLFELKVNRQKALICGIQYVIGMELYLTQRFSSFRKFYTLFREKLDLFHSMEVLFPENSQKIPRIFPYHGKHFHTMELDKNHGNWISQPFSTTLPKSFYTMERSNSPSGYLNQLNAILLEKPLVKVGSLFCDGCLVDGARVCVLGAA